MYGGPRLHPREGGPKVPVAYYPCAALRVDTQLNAGGEDQKRERHKVPGGEKFSILVSKTIDFCFHTLGT